MPTTRWTVPARRPPSLIGAHEFRFLNVIGTLERLGWDAPNTDKLWRYNLHYFDDLNALDAPSRHGWHLALVKDWIAANPPRKGTGWEPYPTSLRIVNWIKWALAGNELSEKTQYSLAIQTRWLTRRLERHLLGNHLFANAKALIFAGLWFEGDEARCWRETGFRILAREVPEQILPDGGQFELSPMYHALAVEDMLDLVNVARCFSEALTAGEQGQLANWEAQIPAMRHWLQTMCHPDGEIAFFNDAAMGIAPSVAKLDAYAMRLGFSETGPLDRLIWLAESGYGRLSRDNAVLLVDMARIGPDYLPGHAHADTLSFEFSFEGQRVMVNSGTSVYGTSSERLRQRGTAAHSTVVVANRDSSEIWSGFRVARRAKIVSARVQSQNNALIAEGGHDGYRRLKGAPVHHRRWRLSSDFLEVKDHLSTDRQPAEARFHFHPDIEVSQTSAEEGLCVMPNGRQLIWRSPGTEAHIEPGTWHPEFGRSIPNACLVLPLKNAKSAFRLSWT